MCVCVRERERDSAELVLAEVSTFRTTNVWTRPPPKAPPAPRFGSISKWPASGISARWLWAMRGQVSAWEHVTRPGLVGSRAPGQVGPCFVGGGRRKGGEPGGRAACWGAGASGQISAQPDNPSRLVLLHFQSVFQPQQLPGDVVSYPLGRKCC